MTAYYGFALFAVCFGGILFGVGMGLHWGTRVGEKRGQQAAEFAYSYGLLNKTGPTMADELAIARAAYANQVHQAALTGTPNPSQGWGYAGNGIGALQGIVGPTGPSTWTVSGGGGGAGGYAGTAGLPNPLTNYGSAGSQISSKI